jgi:hypothetical protein
MIGGLQADLGSMRGVTELRDCPGGDRISTGLIDEEKQTIVQGILVI